MGNLEQNVGLSLEGRIGRRAEGEVADARLAVALPAAMRLAGLEDDLTPNPATRAAWEARLN